MSDFIYFVVKRKYIPNISLGKGYIFMYNNHFSVVKNRNGQVEIHDVFIATAHECKTRYKF